MLAIILAGVLAAVISLIRREPPSIFPMLGVVANMVLVGLFWQVLYEPIWIGRRQPIHDASSYAALF